MIAKENVQNASGGLAREQEDDDLLSAWELPIHTSMYLGPHLA